jgi:hypothetical protein
MTPSPWQCSHRPPGVLKEKCLDVSPAFFASGNPAYRLRIEVNTSVYVATLDRLILPRGDWSTVTMLPIASKPVMLPHPFLNQINRNRMRGIKYLYRLIELEEMGDLKP